MDGESVKTDTAGAGLDMRKMLASVIITEKATTEPSVVMNALIRCLQVPEVRPPPPTAAPMSPATCDCLCVHPLLSTCSWMWGEVLGYRDGQDCEVPISRGLAGVWGSHVVSTILCVLTVGLGVMALEQVS